MSRSSPVWRERWEPCGWPPRRSGPGASRLIDRAATTRSRGTYGVAARPLGLCRGERNEGGLGRVGVAVPDVSGGVRPRRPLELLSVDLGEGLGHGAVVRIAEKQIVDAVGSEGALSVWALVSIRSVRVARAIPIFLRRIA